MAWDKPMPAASRRRGGGSHRRRRASRCSRCSSSARSRPRACVALASSRSAGKRLPFAGGELVVEEMTDRELRGRRHRAVLGRCGASASEFRDAVTRRRLRHDRQLLGVPHGRRRAARGARGQSRGRRTGTPASSPTRTARPSRWSSRSSRSRDLAPIERVVVSTYQAASGAGQAAMDELYAQTRRLPGRRASSSREQFAHRIAFNCIPQIDVFLDDGSTKEEWKMVVETQEDHARARPRGRRDVRARAGAALPLRGGQRRVRSRRCRVEAARAALAAAPGHHASWTIPAAKPYPMPALLEGTDDTYVGRLRADATRRARTRAVGRRGPAAQGRGAQRRTDSRGAAAALTSCRRRSTGGARSRPSADVRRSDSMAEADILIVEDDATIARFVELELTHAGFRRAAGRRRHDGDRAARGRRRRTS